jgi:hypothetical protein
VVKNKKENPTGNQETSSTVVSDQPTTTTNTTTSTTPTTTTVDTTTTPSQESESSKIETPPILQPSDSKGPKELMKLKSFNMDQNILKNSKKQPQDPKDRLVVVEPEEASSDYETPHRKDSDSSPVSKLVIPSLNESPVSENESTKESFDHSPRVEKSTKDRVPLLTLEKTIFDELESAGFESIDALMEKVQEKEGLLSPNSIEKMQKEPKEKDPDKLKERASKKKKKKWKGSFLSLTLQKEEKEKDHAKDREKRRRGSLPPKSRRGSFGTKKKKDPASSSSEQQPSDSLSIIEEEGSSNSDRSPSISRSPSVESMPSSPKVDPTPPLTPTSSGVLRMLSPRAVGMASRRRMPTQVVSTSKFSVSNNPRVDLLRYMAQEKLIQLKNVRRRLMSPEIKKVTFTMVPPDGKPYTFKAPVNVTGQELLFASTFTREKIGCTYPHYFSLCTMKEGIPCWIDMSQPMQNQVNFGTEIHIRVKYFKQPFYVDPLSAHFFYLETLQRVISGVSYCPEETAIELASYQLQSTFGDFNPEIHKVGRLDPCLKEYFPPHVLETTPSIELQNRVFALYKDHQGLSAADAELKYLDIARNIPSCGAHLYQAKVRKIIFFFHHE